LFFQFKNTFSTYSCTFQVVLFLDGLIRWQLSKQKLSLSFADPQLRAGVFHQPRTRFRPLKIPHCMMPSNPKIIKLGLSQPYTACHTCAAVVDASLIHSFDSTTLGAVAVVLLKDKQDRPLRGP